MVASKGDGYASGFGCVGTGRLNSNQPCRFVKSLTLANECPGGSDPQTSMWLGDLAFERALEGTYTHEGPDCGRHTTTAGPNPGM